jgi:pseudouridylate synthase
MRSTPANGAPRVRADLGDLVQLSAEVEEALHTGAPVVAFETTLVSHGFPYPEGARVANECARRVRELGGAPATIGIVDGRVRVGLDESETEQFAAKGPDGVRKASPRDLAACLVQGGYGAVTVAGALAICQLLGIRVMGTGGLGGVHRGYPTPPDVSADLEELTRAQVLIVSSGAKSLLDIAATMELLETLGVPVLGWRTDTLPLFYAATGGPAIPTRVDELSEVAAIAEAHWRLSRHALLLTRPPSPALEDAEPLIEEAVAEAAAQGVRGQAVTPFVLSRLAERSDGRTVAVNKQLIIDNARLAGEVAAELAARTG